MADYNITEINDIISVLDLIGENLKDLLSEANSEQLYNLNAITFAIYSMVFGEIKVQIYEQEASRRKAFDKQYNITRTIEQRIGFIERKG